MYVSILNVFGRVFRWPICFYNFWNRIAGLLPACIVGFINQFARGWVYITCNEDLGNTFTQARHMTGIDSENISRKKRKKKKNL